MQKHNYRSWKIIIPVGVAVAVYCYGMYVFYLIGTKQ